MSKNAKIQNNTTHLKVLPPLKCEKTGRVLKEQRLLPGENLIPEEYVAQALGGMGKDQFVINKETKGHPGVSAVFKSKDITVMQMDQGTDLNKVDDLKGVNVDIARGMISEQTDRNTLINWYLCDTRKGIWSIIADRAAELGFELPAHPKA